MSGTEKLLTKEDVKKLAKKEAKLLVAPLLKTVTCLKRCYAIPLGLKAWWFRTGALATTALRP